MKNKYTFSGHEFRECEKYSDISQKIGDSEKNEARWCTKKMKLDNTDILVKDDIFRLLRESGVGVPAYYEEIPFEVDGETGTYCRSRSGCYFCFFQQKIKWIWLYEQHPDLFKKANYNDQMAA